MVRRSLGTRVITILVLASLLIAACVAPPFGTLPVARADTLTVCPSGCGYTHIQDALNAASSGDTILVASGTYAENLAIYTDVTLTGAGVGNAIIDGGNNGTVVSIYGSPTIVMSGFTIQHGAVTGANPGGDAPGGGIYNEGTLALSAAAVVSNTVTGGLILTGSAGNGRGGGIYSSGALTLSGVTIGSNTTTGGTACTSSGGSGTCAAGSGYGGGIYSSGALTLSSTTITGNTTTGGTACASLYDNSCTAGSGYGGGIYSTAPATLTSTTVSGNSVSGGAACNTSYLNYSCTGGNSDGGGIYTAGPLSISNGTLSGNSLSGGAAYYSYDGSMGGSTYGGGIYSASSLIARTAVITGNSLTGGSGEQQSGRPQASGGTSQGGGLFATDPVSLTNATVDDNAALGGGGTCSNGGAGTGGGLVTSGTSVVSNSTIAGNAATGGSASSGCPGTGGSATGGGVDNSGGTLILSSVAISTNVASAGAGANGGSPGTASGGGISDGGTLHYTAGTISGNRANALTNAASGGGIAAAGTETVTNATVSGNTATGGTATGGGVYSLGNGVSLTDDTLGGNAATGATSGSGQGGGLGVAAGSGPTTLQNTIIAANSANSGSRDCAGAITSQDYNLIQTTSGCAITGATTHNITGVPAKLGPLQNNGGTQLTMAPLVGSPAIDAVAASNCTVTTDEIGQPRPDEQTDNGACDIGAFETQSSPLPTNTPTNTPVPPTDTPTNTPVLPTNTPSSTPVPPTNTATATPTPAARLAVHPTSGVYGQRITLTGANFGPTETVNIYGDRTGGTPIYTAQTNATGAFTLTATVLAGPYGPHTLIAVGQTSGLTARTTFVIKPRLVLRPTAGAPGTTTLVTGYGFGATEKVTIRWNTATGTLLATAISTASGSLSTTFKVPASKRGGYLVYGTGQRTKATAAALYTVT